MTKIFNFQFIFGFLLLAGMLLICDGNIIAQEISTPTLSLANQNQIESKQVAPLAERVKRGELAYSKIFSYMRPRSSNLYRLPALTEEEMRDKGSGLLSQPVAKPLRIGTVRTFSPALDPISLSRTYSLSDGTVSVMAIISSKSLMTRLHFVDFDLPPGARLFVYSAKNPNDVYGPYERQGISDTKDFWTPPVEGEKVIVEYFVPENISTSGMPPFLIAEVSHMFKDPLHSPNEGTCHNNIPSQWATTAKAVGGVDWIQTPDQLFCTGTLLSNQSDDLAPFFLTAEHCGVNNSNAQSVRVWWFYDAAGQSLSGKPHSDVARWLASRDAISGTDFTLLQLLGSVPSGMTWAGWTTAMPGLFSAVVGIHHPDGAYKRISYGDIGTGCPSGITCANFLPVDWDNVGGGVTEVGSSGSGLWRDNSSNPQLVGQLYGGGSSCGNPFSNDYYGRFDLTYNQISSYMNGTWSEFDDSLEQNDSRATSRTVAANASYGSLVVKYADEDWYKINVPTGSTVSFTTNFEHTYGDIELFLYRGGDLTTIDTSETSSDSEVVAHTNTGPASDYFVRAFLHRGTTYSSTRNTYNMNVSLQGSGGTPPGSFTLTLTPECSGTTSQIKLNWTPSTGATTYDVYRNGSLYPAGAGLTGTQFINSGNITVGASYSYYVQAKNSAGSKNSDTQSATAPNCTPTAPSIQFSTSNYSVNESDGSVTITATRTGGTGAFNVNYATSNGTAIAGQDYTAKSGTLSFGSSDTSKTFSVSIINDTTVESNETVNLTLSSPTGGANLGSPSTTVLTIFDNDAGCPPPASITVGQTRTGSLASSDCVVSGTGRYYDVYSFSGTAGQGIAASMDSSGFDTYLYLTNSANQILDEDNNSGPGTNSRIPNSSGFFTLPATGSYFLWASSATDNATGAYSVGLLQCTYLISSSGNTVGPGNGGGSFLMDTQSGCAWSAVSDSTSWLTTSSSGSGDGTVSYNFTANPNTSPRTGRITVGGQVSTITQIGVGGAGNVRFSSTIYAANEGGGDATITVTRTSGTGTGTVSYSTSDGTATAGTDYTPASGTLIFSDNVTSRTFPVTILDDTAFEGNESINLSLSNPSTSLTLGNPSTATLTIIDNDSSPMTVQFSAASFSVNEGNGRATITVTRAGDATGVASIAYVTVDDPAAVRCDIVNGTAYARCDYATTMDRLEFAAGESQKTFTIPVIDDAHAEGPETVMLRLSGTAGATLGAQGTATLTINDNDAAAGPNPINFSPFLVRMQYLDFLSREPESGEPWTNVLNNCPNPFNTDPNSLSAGCDRNLVSSAFFRSQEFQLKGYYVFLFYKVSFGRLPQYDEIVSDMRTITGQTSAEVFAKRAAFADAWAQRQGFRSAYDSMSNAAYVDALLGPYGLSAITTPDPTAPDGDVYVTLTKSDLVGRLGAGTLTRAQVLRAVVQSREADAREYNGAFVAMQYYGYLRRTPEAGGYQAWLNYLNSHPSDFRTMIDGFLNSVEYKLRFGTP